ncbi:MAG: hypothetical protein A3I66_04810 [Burkholderiales bacterium RIFCSPLOWO2_02_FULL_57_36]|nr:MAG: hypothetical protein A3I66_04810 [Burkholderiales bacterium RIFCSPLOWO2_02_FULL_57_36]
MLTLPTIRTLTMLALNISLGAFAPGLAHAAPCKCKDIDAIASEIQRVSTGEAAWKEIFAWARGLRRDVAMPQSNDEMNTKFLQLARTPRSNWDRTMREPIVQVETPEKAGGLNDDGEVIINEDFAQSHCDEIVEGVRVHERAHRDFFLSPGNFLEGGLMSSRHMRLRSESEVISYRTQKAFLEQKLDALKKQCGKVSFKDVTIDCTIKTPVCSIRTGQKIAGSVCGDPLKETWTITPHYFAEGCGAPSGGTRGDKPFDNDCVKAGSDEEKRRASIYTNARAMGGGGWMCVYSEGPQPKITIRSFRLSMCDGAAEQTITVNAEVSKSCGDPSQPPVVPAAPPSLPPNS